MTRTQLNLAIIAKLKPVFDLYGESAIYHRWRGTERVGNSNVDLYTDYSVVALVGEATRHFTDALDGSVKIQSQGDRAIFFESYLDGLTWRDLSKNDQFTYNSQLFDVADIKGADGVAIGIGIEGS